jgi:hypothetical protein
MQTFKLVGNDSVLLSQPILIKQFGRSGAQLLSQLHYWLTKNDCLGYNHQGKRWVYNTAEEWGEQLQISARHVRRLISGFVDLGIIKVEKLHKLKSVRTNYYSIDYDQLNNSIGAIENKSNSFNQPQDKMSESLGQNDLIYIQKLPNKDFNKSDKFSKNLEVVGQGGIENSLSQGFCETEQVKQVKNLNLKNEKRLDALQETPTTCSAIEKNKADETNLLLPKTATAQDMLKVWNDSFAGKAETKLNKELAPLLVSAFKNKFAGNIANWQYYCDQLKSSSYLMADEFKLTIIWALKFSTIERIRAGELGVKLKTIEGQGGNSDAPFDDHQINQMIEALEESNQAKQLRHKITKAIGCAAYYSWFHSSKFCEEGGELRMVAPNPFVEMYWETHFDWVSRVRILVDI